MCIWNFKLIKLPLSGMFWIATGCLLNKRWRLYNRADCTFMNLSEICAAGLDWRPSGLDAHLHFSGPEFKSLSGLEFLFLWILTQSSKDRKNILQLQLCISYPCFQIKNKTSSGEAGAPGYKTTCKFSRAATSIISPNHQYSSPSVFDGDPLTRLKRMESYRCKQTGPRYGKTG